MRLSKTQKDRHVQPKKWLTEAFDIQRRLLDSKHADSEMEAADDVQLALANDKVMKVTVRRKLPIVRPDGGKKGL